MGSAFVLRTVKIVALLAVVPPPAAAQADENNETRAEAAHFVALRPMSVPVVDGPNTEGFLQTELVVFAPDADTAERLTRRMPEVRARALATTLEFARLSTSVYQSVDAEALAAILEKDLAAITSGSRILVVQVFTERAG